MRLPPKRLSTHYETCWNVTKYHACHVKLGYATFEISKSDHFCRTRHRHGHSDLIVNGCQRLLTVADGCRRLPTVADACDRRSGVERTRLHPQTPKVRREPFATHSGTKARGILSLASTSFPSHITLSAPASHSLHRCAEEQVQGCFLQSHAAITRVMFVFGNGKVIFGNWEWYSETCIWKLGFVFGNWKVVVGN